MRASALISGEGRRDLPSVGSIVWGGLVHLNVLQQDKSITGASYPWTSQPQTVVETWWSSGEQGIEHQIQHSQSFQSAPPFSANLNSTGRLNCPISFFTSVSPRQMMAGIEIQSPFVDATEEPVYFFLAVEIRFQKINRFSSHFSFCLSSWLTTRAFIERFNHSAHRNGARRKYGVESILV